MKRFAKWTSIASAAAMGLSLPICGLTFTHWQFWMLYGTAFLWACAAYSHGEYQGSKEN
jgi:hypothetical protein